MQRRHLRHALIAAATALTALSARADTTMPGTACISDGPTGRSVTGLMLNKVTSPAFGRTDFHCPIVRTQPVSIYGGTVTIHINVKLNLNTDFECWVRSVKADNVTHDNVKIIFPGGNGTNADFDMRTASVSLPPLAPAALNMRCHVPNNSSVEAGIVSYRVEQ
jgi:hypothetical protein